MGAGCAAGTRIADIGNGQVHRTGSLVLWDGSGWNDLYDTFNHRPACSPTLTLGGVWKGSGGFAQRLRCPPPGGDGQGSGPLTWGVER